ncbi:MAG: alanine racemase [Calditrichaeota bacterium]|nr:alanine racemase [Calditrichota bacterium]
MGPTRAYIFHSNLINNLKLIQNAVAPARVMGVVKADAYGHGSVQVARTLIENGVNYLGVAFHEEGIELRKAGIEAPILVFGAHLSNFFPEYLNYNLDITLTDSSQLEPLRSLCISEKKKARVQIKIDTGMGRIGFFPEKDLQLILKILDEPSWQVVGVYSHLSSADEEDREFTQNQIAAFLDFQKKIKSKYPGLIFHLANSAAIMRFPQAYFDMVRPGVMLYGNPPSPDFKHDWTLKEVMAFKSKITLIKKMPAGRPVSYNRRYHTPRQTHIAVIPAGYADGYNRRFTNKGTVLIRGKRYPVVGTVCMDQFMVDLGPATDVKIGDEVVIFGKQGKEHIKIIEIAKTLQTIPYEVTCWISRRVPRIHCR